MLPWSGFAAEEPDMAAAGAALLYQFGGVGLAFLGTTRPDGGPRVHPMCPILCGDRLYALLIPSPKRDDLHRDPRYALHCYPPDDNEDAFFVRGVAEEISEATVMEPVRQQFLDERGWSSPPPDFDRQELFEFQIERALLTTTKGHGDPAPRHRVWRADA